MKSLLNVLLLFVSMPFLIATLVEEGKDDKFPFTTVVDVLSQNVEFSTFLRVLQRGGYVPFLNELQNFTLLAPVNWAFTSGAVEEDNIDLDNYIIYDTVLNMEEVPVGFHVSTGNHKFPLLLNQPSDEKGATINGIQIVDPDLKPTSQNATIQGMSALLENVPSYREVISEYRRKTNDLHYLSELINSTGHLFPKMDRMFANKTLFLPEDDTFKNHFNDIEIEYLVSQATDKYVDRSIFEFKKNNNDWLEDKLFLLQKFIVEDIWGGLLRPMNLTNGNNDLLLFSTRRNGSIMQVNGSTSTKSNLIYDSGIAHVFPELNILREGIHFNAEKYMIGMKSYEFVEEIYFRNLQHLINGEESANITIFAPMGSANEVPGFSKSNILYHFSESHITLEDDFPAHSSRPCTRLYDSMFCSSNKRLGGQCQRLKITRHSSGKQVTYSINGKYLLREQKPLKIGNTLIYMVENELDLPGDFLSSINPFLHCSRSLGFLQDLNLLDLKPNNKGYTVLLPCFDSWDYFGLDLDYLERNISALNLVMKNYILNGLVYTDSANLKFDTSNLYGEHIAVETNDLGQESSDLELTLSTVSDPIYLEKGLDIVFDQGVIHPLKEVFFPQMLNITLRNLVDTTGCFDFLLFLESFENLAAIVNEDGPFSILVPTSRSLLMEDINLNSTRLEDFLKLHLIPSNSTNALLNCGKTIDTMYGEPLSCREASPNTYLLNLQNGLDKEVRILKKGCTTSDSKSCVFLIDRPISLAWLNQERYRITLPGVAFAVGILLGALCIISLLMCALVVFIGKHKIPGQGDDDEVFDDERRPINPPSGAVPSYSSNARQPPSTTSRSSQPQTAISSKGQNFENSYSHNASSQPILVSQP